MTCEDARSLGTLIRTLLEGGRPFARCSHAGGRHGVHSVDAAGGRGWARVRCGRPPRVSGNAEADPALQSSLSGWKVGKNQPQAQSARRKRKSSAIINWKENKNSKENSLNVITPACEE